MTAGDRLIVLANARRCAPRYRDAFLAEFFGVPRRCDDVALAVEALLTELVLTWRRHGRAGW